jgi:hypothetical protein
VPNLLHNDTVARALSRAIADGDASMDSVPGLLRRIITENMWQERIVPESGEVITFKRFEDFVATPPLEGLGATMDVIRALCKKQEDVLILLDEVTRKALNQNGGDRTSVIYNTGPNERGTGREYTVARLERDGQSDLAQRVINREVTAAEARRIAGWEKEKIAIRLDDPASAAQTILKRMDKSAIVELCTILAEAIQNDKQTT